MKIIRTIESFYPKITGPANQAFKISSMLEEGGIKSPIFTTNFDVNINNIPAEEKIQNVEIKRFPITTRFLKYIYSPKMKAALEQEDFDIIHAHCYRSYQSDISLKIALKKKKPFVISTHGTLLSYKYFVNKPWHLAYACYDMVTLKKTVKRADAVIVNSKGEYEEALNFGVKKEKLHLIPVGIDTEKYESKRKFEKKNELKLLYVGAITRNRPLENVLDALRIIKEKNKDENKEENEEKKEEKKVKLIMVGYETGSSFSTKKGYIDILKKKVMENNLWDDVVFIDKKYPNELIKYYQEADVFIYPSKYESFGQPILEAMASGLPVICTNVGIVKDIIKNGENGFIVINHPLCIAEKILRLVDPITREKFSEINKVIVGGYKWENIIKTYIDLYSSLIK